MAFITTPIATVTSGAQRSQISSPTRPTMPRTLRSPASRARVCMSAASSSSSSSSTPTAAAAEAPHPESLAAAWPPFAEAMRAADAIPPYEDWHALLAGCLRARESPESAVWVLNLMRETGRTPVAATYELAIQICLVKEDSPAIFYLVELMYTDKVLLGDVELPEHIETLLRSILPPEAFE